MFYSTLHISNIYYIKIIGKNYFIVQYEKSSPNLTYLTNKIFFYTENEHEFSSIQYPHNKSTLNKKHIIIHNYII